MSVLHLQIYTPERRLSLRREVQFERVPFVGEYVNFDGILFSRAVTDVTHDQDGQAHVMVGACGGTPGGVDLFLECEAIEVLPDLEEAGWRVDGDLPNHHHASLVDLFGVISRLCPPHPLGLTRAELPELAAELDRALALGCSVLAPCSAATAMRLNVSMQRFVGNHAAAAALTDAEVEQIRELAMQLNGSWRALLPWHRIPNEMTAPAPPPNGNLFLCLNVANLSASCDFYAKLGFKQIGGDLAENWAMVSDGTNEIHLFEGHVPSNTLNFRGGDVFGIAESLKACGLTLESDAAREPDGSAGAWVRDPDGNAIYFNTAPGEELKKG